jgi:hypothetical protein
MLRRSITSAQSFRMRNHSKKPPICARERASDFQQIVAMTARKSDLT